MVKAKNAAGDTPATPTAPEAETPAVVSPTDGDTTVVELTPEQKLKTGLKKCALAALESARANYVEVASDSSNLPADKRTVFVRLGQDLAAARAAVEAI